MKFNLAICQCFCHHSLYRNIVTITLYDVNEMEETNFRLRQKRRISRRPWLKLRWREFQAIEYPTGCTHNQMLKFRNNRQPYRWLLRTASSIADVSTWHFWIETNAVNFVVFVLFFSCNSNCWRVAMNSRITNRMLVLHGIVSFRWNTRTSWEYYASSSTQRSYYIDLLGANSLALRLVNRKSGSLSTIRSLVLLDKKKVKNLFTLRLGHTYTTSENAENLRIVWNGKCW